MAMQCKPQLDIALNPSVKKKSAINPNKSKGMKKLRKS